MADVDAMFAALTAGITELTLKVNKLIETVGTGIQPAPVAGSLASWIKPADLNPIGRIDKYTTETRAIAEIRARALYGYIWTGDRWCKGNALLAAWDEVEKLKALNQSTVYSYRGGFYAMLDPEVAAFILLTGKIAPSGATIEGGKAWAGISLDQLILRDLGTNNDEQGPS
jgi:hypothetical protein